MVTVSVVGGGGGGAALALTVSTADCVAPPAEPVIVAVRVVVPVEVDTVKLALDAPAGIVTDAGTVATVVAELDRLTTSPPVGAVWFDVTTPVDVAPPVTVDGLTDSVESAAAGGVLGNGSTVSVALSVTPPPVTEIVTSVLVAGAVVEMMNPPAAANCGTMTEFGTCATSGRELESENVMSPLRGSAAVTRPFEPLLPDVTAGSSVSDVGAGCGVSVVVAWTDCPCQVAVIVTSVFAETWLVVAVKDVDSTPAGTVTVAGGCTAGLELERLTTAPPGGACPFSMTIPPIVTPPFWLAGRPSRLASDDGLTVRVFVVETPPIVAVIVTVVGVATWPVTKCVSTQELVAGTETVDGTGATCAFELQRLTVAPPAGAPLLSCRSTKTSCPLAGASRVRLMVFTCNGPSGTTKVPTWDHAVAAAVPAVSITPWNERTRQNFGPGLFSWMTV